MRTNHFFTTAMTIALVGTAIAGCHHPSSIVNDDLAKRSQDIHWPEGFTPDKADLFAHNEILINASCQTVWQHIVQAQKWPEWYPNAHQVQILNDSTGILQKDSRFTWETFGLHIDSRISEFVPDSRIGWFGDGKELNAYHTWLLTGTSGGGCKVVMEEVVKGPGAVALYQSDPGAMHRGHDLWNNTLKKVSEQ
jgi:hypothetical protein